MEFRWRGSPSRLGPCAAASDGRPRVTRRPFLWLAAPTTALCVLLAPSLLASAETARQSGCDRAVAADATATATDEGSSLLGRLAESCATNSFSAGTLVVMADGSAKPISQVKVGDKVEATDPTTGKAVAATVSHLFLNDDHSLADVLVRERDGATATLHATQGHRFWDRTLDEWVLATQLRAGDALLADDGSQVVVEAVHSWQGSQWMYDLTVDGIHTFYVTAGSASMLVHNCPIDLPETSGLMRQAFDHMQKLDDYANNPLDYDNQGMLARAIAGEGGDPNVIYDSRIASLVRQIWNFRSQAEGLNGW